MEPVVATGVGALLTLVGGGIMIARGFSRRDRSICSFGLCIVVVGVFLVLVMVEAMTVL